MGKLKVGSLAPEFSLPNHEGTLVSLNDFSGQRVVIYFYAKDDSLGCTTEACQFNELVPGFSTLNATVVGISPDSTVSHEEFREKYGLDITLLSDPDHTVMDAYGAWYVKVRWTGQTIVRAIRSTVVVGPDRRVLAAWYDVTPEGHAAQVREALETLAT